MLLFQGLCYYFYLYYYHVNICVVFVLFVYIVCYSLTSLVGNVQKIESLERASYHLYSYFGTNYFDVLFLIFYFIFILMHRFSMSCDYIIVFIFFKDVKKNV